jgi:hypothetical protein
MLATGIVLADPAVAHRCVSPWATAADATGFFLLSVAISRNDFSHRSLNLLPRWSPHHAASRRRPQFPPSWGRHFDARFLPHVTSTAPKKVSLKGKASSPPPVKAKEKPAGLKRA